MRLFKKEIMIKPNINITKKYLSKNSINSETRMTLSISSEVQDIRRN